MLKNKVITLHRVHDRVLVKEGEQTLQLSVDIDPFRVTAALNQAQKRIAALTADSAPEELAQAAMLFAGAIFGQEQAERLLAFYGGDAASAINACGLYFKNHLRRKIDKAQRKAR